MNWTDERIATLTKMWEGGATASQIADELGGVSRNAVIGKAHRLGLKARPSPVKAAEQAAKKKAAAKKVAQPEARELGRPIPSVSKEAPDAARLPCAAGPAWAHSPSPARGAP